MDEEIAFEMHSRNHSMLIYAGGRVEFREGDPKLPSKMQVIVNHIPTLIAKAVAGAITKKDL